MNSGTFRVEQDLKGVALLVLGNGHCSSPTQPLQKCLGSFRSRSFEAFLLCLSLPRDVSLQTGNIFAAVVKLLLCLCFLHVCICRFIDNNIIKKTITLQKGKADHLRWAFPSFFGVYSLAWVLDIC